MIFLKKTIIQFCHILNMNESNSIKATDKTNLSEQKKFRLSEIIGIENYFYQEIDQRTLYSKKSNKYVTAFDYIDLQVQVLHQFLLLQQEQLKNY